MKVDRPDLPLASGVVNTLLQLQPFTRMRLAELLLIGNGPLVLPAVLPSLQRKTRGRKRKGRRAA